MFTHEISCSEEGMVTFRVVIAEGDGLTHELTSQTGLLLSNALMGGDLNFGICVDAFPCVTSQAVNMTASGQVMYGYQDEALNMMWGKRYGFESK